MIHNGWRQIGIVLFIVGGIVVNIDAQEQINLLSDGDFEANIKVSENLQKGHVFTDGWMFLRGMAEGERRWEITNESAVMGKMCFKMTNVTGEGSMHLKMMPERPVSEFKGPYRVSCWIKVHGHVDPASTPVRFILGGRTRGIGCNARYTIAEIKGNTGWNKYSAIVDRNDIPFKSLNDLWFISILVSGLKGSVWVDDVQVVPMDEPSLRVSLNSRECFSSQKIMIVRGEANPKFIDVGKASIEIEFSDSLGIPIRRKTGIVHTRNIIVPLDISELPEGKYAVKIHVTSKYGRWIRCKRTFRITEDPIPLLKSSKTKRQGIPNEKE